MARPISPTPVLVGQDAVDFAKRIDADLKKRVRLVPTPKIERARALVKQYAAKSQK